MKSKLLSLTALIALAMGSSLFAAGSEQATGKVSKISDTAIWVENGNQKWVFIRDSNTKMDSAVKLGADVTVTYTKMSSGPVATQVTAGAAAENPTASSTKAPAKVGAAAPGKSGSSADAQKREGATTDAQKREEPTASPSPSPTPEE